MKEKLSGFYSKKKYLCTYVIQFVIVILSVNDRQT